MFGLFKKKKAQLTEMYTSVELEVVDAHIKKHFGSFDNVLHEIVSPDIHVDICVIRPTPERNHYTLVTMGMGAHSMNIPKELRGKNLDRAEVLIELPPDWDLSSDDEKWYWPLRWLKIMARLPIYQDTWLGYGHTVPTKDGFAENTKLCCMYVSMPYFYGVHAHACKIPGGKEIRFYQLIPLLEDEMSYKLEHGADALEDKFPGNFSSVVDIARTSVLEQPPGETE